MKKIWSLVAVLLAATLVFTGCSSSGSSEGDVVTITVTDNAFDSQALHNQIAKFIVENGYDGYELVTSTGSSTMNWQALIQGDIDLDIDSWTDNVATYPEDVANGDVIPLGVLVPDSSQGFYVPRYVVEGDPERGIEPMAPDLRHVRDLLNYPELFPDEEQPGRARIYGAVPGWMIDTICYNKYLYYGLDEYYEYFRMGSESTLFASLVSAYNLGEPWVGYCYEPTWVSGKLDLIKLEDEPYDPELYEQGGCEIPDQEVMIVCNKYFKEKAPDLVEFFEKYQTGSEIVSKALAYIDETKCTHEEAAIWVLTEYDYLLDQWLPAERAQRVRDALQNT